MVKTDGCRLGENDGCRLVKTDGCPLGMGGRVSG